MGKLICDSTATSSPPTPWRDPTAVSLPIAAVDLSQNLSVAWDDVAGLEPQQKTHLKKLETRGILWKSPSDPTRSAVFRLRHGGDVDSDGNCLFSAAARLVGVPEKELRRRAVRRFEADFGDVREGEREIIESAIRNMYSPDVGSGWGVHVVQEVKMLAKKGDRVGFDSAIDELVQIGMLRESAAESIYKERCIPIDDGPSWAKYMSISGSRDDDEYDIITLQYTEEGLLTVDENREGHAAAFGDDIAIECLATEFKQEIYVIAMVNVDLVFVTGVIGDVVSAGFYLSPIPTFTKIRQNSSTVGYSSVPYVVALLSAVIWLYYAVLVRDSILLTINCIGTLCQTFYIIFYLVYSTLEARKKILYTQILPSLLTFFGFILPFTLIHFRLNHKLRVTVVGYIATSISCAVFASPFAIMCQVCRTKTTEYMSLPFSISLTSSAIIWYTYGQLKVDSFVMVPNFLGIFLGVGQLIVYSVYQKGGSSEPATENFVTIELETDQMETVPTEIWKGNITSSEVVHDMLRKDIATDIEDVGNVETVGVAGKEVTGRSDTLLIKQESRYDIVSAAQNMTNSSSLFVSPPSH